MIAVLGPGLNRGPNSGGRKRSPKLNQSKAHAQCVRFALGLFLGLVFGQNRGPIVAVRKGSRGWNQHVVPCIELGITPDFNLKSGDTHWNASQHSAVAVGQYLGRIFPFGCCHEGLMCFIIGFACATFAELWRDEVVNVCNMSHSIPKHMFENVIDLRRWKQRNEHSGGERDIRIEEEAEV